MWIPKMWLICLNGHQQHESVCSSSHLQGSVRGVVVWYFFRAVEKQWEDLQDNILQVHIKLWWIEVFTQTRGWNVQQKLDSKLRADVRFALLLTLHKLKLSQALMEPTNFWLVVPRIQKAWMSGRYGFFERTIYKIFHMKRPKIRNRNRNYIPL